MKVNVLGFSECGMRCDCGCRVVLGLERGSAREVLRVLKAAGFTLAEPSDYGEIDARAIATEEPMYRGALGAFCRYAE